MSRLEVRMCALYPDHMNIYADRGNIVFVQRRCEWRGIGFRLSGSGFGDDLDPAAHDLLYMGGGQDSDQVRVAGDLVETKAGALREAVGSGTPMLAVCGGYQLLGHSYQLADETLPGTGLADLRTVREPGERLIGNVAIEVELDGRRHVVAGFENHGGRTYLGDGAQPLGSVLAGHGNNGSDGLEGVRRDNLLGTYLHGPLLPKNAWLADWLIERALECRYGPQAGLMALDDRFEEAAHAQAREAAGVG